MPKLKTQIPNKFQTQEIQIQMVFWKFRFPVCLGFEIWIWSLRHSMAEVPNAGKDHGHFTFIGSGDDFLIAH
jgi:hypothetical protein